MLLIDGFSDDENSTERAQSAVYTQPISDHAIPVLPWSHIIAVIIAFVAGLAILTVPVLLLWKFYFKKNRREPSPRLELVEKIDNLERQIMGVEDEIHNHNPTDTGKKNSKETDV